MKRLLCVLPAALACLSARARLFLLLCLLVLPCKETWGQAGMQQGNARVVFVGDSITGLGGGWIGTGYTYPMRSALEKVYPGCEPRLLALGGSGMGVNSWLGLVRKPLQEEKFLDVKGVGVKATLDEPADILIIMLGMNDILAPYVGDTPEAIDTWRDRYRELIGVLRETLQPKVIGLCSITHLTEAPDSAKNLLLGKMNDRLRNLASEMNIRYLPVSEAVWDVQKLGRTFDPEFHTTYDLIHPNAMGQVAIAVGMLRGLDETAAAEYLVEEKITPKFPVSVESQPILSYQALTGSEPIRVRYWLHQASPVKGNVRLVAPPGWTVEPEKMDTTTGEFVLVGKPDQLQNRFVLAADGMEREIIISAPWLVSAGFVQSGWNGANFDPVRGRNEVDAAIEAGEDFLAVVSRTPDPKASWRLFFPSCNYKGGANPGSVDFAAIVHGRNFEAGYGVRWIHSDRKRTITITPQSVGLAARIYLTVWVNSRQVFADHLTGQLATAEVELQQGWNTLVFKSNHRTWEWQNTIEMSPLAGESLDDLTFAVEPPLP